MAGNIKGITIEFRGDTTRLDKALRQVKNESKSVDQQLKEVNRALRFNPNNAELLQQKFTLLKQKVDATEKELKQFKAIEAQLNERKVSKQSEEWMTVRRQIIEAESKLKHFNAELNKVRFANITALGNSFKTAGANMRSAGMYATIGAGASVMAGKKLLELNQTQQNAENKLVEIYKTRMGVNKKAAQSTMELASALQKQGVIGDEVTLSGAQQLATYAKYPSTVNKLLPAMDNLLVQQKGLDATAEDATSIANLFGKAMMGQTGALKKVGISFTKSQEEVLKYGTEEEKAAMLAEVVTQNVGNMNKVFAETDAGKMQQVKNAFGDIGERLGAVLLPALAQFAEFISANILPALERMMGFLENHPGIAKFAVALTALLAVGGPLLIFFGGIVSAIGTLMGALGSIVGIIGTLGSAFSVLLGPVGLVIAIIGALIAIGILLYKNWDTIKAKLASFKAYMLSIWNSIKASVSNIVTAIKTKITTIFDGIKSAVTSKINSLKTTVSNVFNSIKSTASSVWNSIKSAITKPIETAKSTVKKAINAIKGFFPLSVGKIFSNLKLPHFTISGGKPPFGIGGLGTKPKISVSWYAQGGIFNSPSVIGVGEAGPEAVIPIEKLQTMINASNAQMVSALVTALSALNTGGNDKTIELVVNLGGANVATEIYKLNKQGTMIMEA